MRQPTVKARASAAKPPRARSKGLLAPPDYAIKLMEHMGPTDAAKALGTTPGTLHKARNAGVISKVFEVAARGIWHENGYEAAETVVATAAPLSRTTDLSAAAPTHTSEAVALLLIQVPRERTSMLTRAAEALGAQVISHD